MKQRFWLCLLAALLCACQQDPADLAPQIEVPAEQLSNIAVQREGAALFQAHCSECHGTPAEGRNPRARSFHPPAPDFYDPSFSEKDPRYLFWRISEGKRVEPFYSQGSVMPAFGPYFSEDQIWQLVAYLLRRSGGGR